MEHVDVSEEIENLSEDPLAFERLISELSATLIDLPAEAIDAQIEWAIGRVAEFLELDRSTVAQRSPEDGRLRSTHQWIRPGFPGSPLVSEDSLPLLFARLNGGEPVVVSRLDDLPPEAWRERELAERTGVRSTVTLPLVVGGTVVGGLAFASLRRERSWSPGVLNRLRLVAQIMGNALSRRQTELALRRALSFERLAADAAASFIALTPEAIDAHVETLLGQVGTLLEADRVTVLRYDSADTTCHRTHRWVRDGIPAVPEPETVETFPWTARRVIRRRESLIFSRVDELPPEAVADRRSFTRLAVQSAAVVPLVVDRSAIGLLAVATIAQVRHWPPEVVARLQLVADALASALARKEADLALRAALAENEHLRRRLESDNVYLQQELKGTQQSGDIVGRSPAFQAVLSKVDQVAVTDAPVLLLGETGTGKELIAHAIHAQSRRSKGPLIPVNCAALPASLIESELFGHEKGAFTGAIQAKPGRFELADGGTLFLDEIGDLEPGLQVKLLRVLQNGELQRLGSVTTGKVDVRIVAATNRDLPQAIREGRLRSDLYYRLGVFPIEIPPLRERREDIPLLVWYFIQSRQRPLGRTIDRVPRAAMEALVAYDWPGNVRELQNVIERALILSRGPVLRIEEALGSAAASHGNGQETTTSDALDDAERAHILRVLKRSNWSIEGRGRAAERLGLRPSTLRNRMKRLGIRRPGRPS